MPPAFADRLQAVAPDQRGYAASAKPEGLEACRLKHLLRASPDRPFNIDAHEWGASIAYATAIAAPEAHGKGWWSSMACTPGPCFVRPL